MQRRTIARAVGALFLTATVAGVLSVPLLGPQSAPDSLVSASAHRSQIVLGAVVVVAMILAIALIPAVLFPVLKQHSEALALGYVAIRTVEAVALLPAATNPLLLVVLSSEYPGAGSPDAARFETLRALILSYDEFGLHISTTVFCVGALVLNYLLFRSSLVPRVISAWGFAGAALYLAHGLLVMFDLLAPSSFLGAIMTVPIGLNEMALAVWLVARGFGQPPASAPELTRTAPGTTG